jgi:sterol 3beta-glucosyltransferase
LRSAGHTVRLATHEGFRDLVTDHGIEFAPVTHPPTALVSDPVWRRWQQSGDRFDRYIADLWHIAKAARPLLENMLDDFWSACQGADGVIASASGFGSPLMAKALGAGHSWALLQPMSRTRQFPYFMTPGRLWLPKGLRYETYKLADQVYWRLFRSAVSAWSERNLGSPFTSKRDSGGFLARIPSPTFYGISNHVVPRPSDWSADIHMHGFWFLEPHVRWEPPDQLMRFLEDSPAPVYVALSRINAHPPERLLDTVVEALHRCGQRGLVSIEGFQWPELPSTIMAVSSIPHHWLFKRVAAVVHHGGAGTTASALRAGVPSLGVPSFFDQPFWSRRIVDLGVGVDAIPVSALTSDRLAASICQVTSDMDLQKRARSLGRLIRQERGVEATVAGLERHFAG